MQARIDTESITPGQHKASGHRDMGIGKELVMDLAESATVTSITLDVWGSGWQQPVKDAESKFRESSGSNIPVKLLGTATT